VFTHCYFNSHIKTDSLPVHQSPTATYFSQDANFLVGWVNSFLYQQRKEKTPFISDFVEELTFTKYDVAYNEAKAEMEMRLDFEISHEDEIQLVLVGALHRSAKGLLGVEWTKKEGNSFLLSAVKTQIVESFNSLL
jgi:hypothetical protein